MEEIINNNNSENIEENIQENTPKTYTQEELDKILQSEKDKAVTQALKTAQKKHEKEMSLANKDAEERARIQLEDQNKELLEKIAQMEIDKARSDLKSTLGARGLDPRFADLLNITDDVIANQKVISEFDKIWKAAINNAVKERIEADTPKATQNVNIEDKDAFKKMGLAEMSKLLSENPDLYDKYFK